MIEQKRSKIKKADKKSKSSSKTKKKVVVKVSKSKNNKSTKEVSEARLMFKSNLFKELELWIPIKTNLFNTCLDYDSSFRIYKFLNGNPNLFKIDSINLYLEAIYNRFTGITSEDPAKEKYFVESLKIRKKKNLKHRKDMCKFMKDLIEYKSNIFSIKKIEKNHRYKIDNIIHKKALVINLYNLIEEYFKCIFEKDDNFVWYLDLKLFDGIYIKQYLDNIYNSACIWDNEFFTLLENSCFNKVTKDRFYRIFIGYKTSRKNVNNEVFIRDCKNNLSNIFEYLKINKCIVKSLPDKLRPKVK